GYMPERRRLLATLRALDLRDQRHEFPLLPRQRHIALAVVAAAGIAEVADCARGLEAVSGVLVDLIALLPEPVTAPRPDFLRQCRQRGRDRGQGADARTDQ